MFFFFQCPISRQSKPSRRQRSETLLSPRPQNLPPMRHVLRFTRRERNRSFPHQGPRSGRRLPVLVVFNFRHFGVGRYGRRC